jgi:predicted phage terminase large subunit-like protein
MTISDPQFQAAALDALLRTSLEAFTWKVFATLNAGRDAPFIHNWHIDAVCHALEEARLGRASNVVINLPPRHSKSTIAAVAFTAWLHGQDPTREILVASHTQRLAALHSDAVRVVMEADWYCRIFPRTRIATGCTRTELRTTAGGRRMAVTAGVATMGFGADAIIIDDLLDAMEARSEVERGKVIDYMDNALLTRISDPAKGLVVCVHQRIHEDDPAGHLLNTGAFSHLKLPAIAEEDEEIALGHCRTHLRKKGTALFPQRFGLDVLEATRRERGTAVFQMLYQQNPIAPDGSVLRWEWFGTYDELLPRNQYELVVQSWDTAMSADPGAKAFSVCTTWGLRERQWYLLHVFRERLDFPDLKRACLRLAEEWRADRVLIEDAASGIPLLQECRAINASRFRGIKPWQDKEIRFNAACAPVEEGKILLPREAPWLADFKRELLGFPRATYKDQADSFSQFVNWSRGTGLWRAIGRDHPMSVARREDQMKLRAIRRDRG